MKKIKILKVVILSMLASPAFSKNNLEEVVVDIHNQLVWQKNGVVEMEHSEAMVRCRDLNYAGKKDWRLPTLNELLSAFWISDRFTNLATYWSSESHQTNTDYKWYVNFENGDVRVDSRGSDNFVRCVRNKT